MIEKDLTVRSHYEGVHRAFARMKPPELAARHTTMQQRILEEGITFTLYAQNQSEPLERTIPFDYQRRPLPIFERVSFCRRLARRQC
ncbi:putative circularly permuted ATP-grasp superfamily protein [Paenibacillus baekrokdamisoli]|uniref:hypothetical protein n=1 Tax=Paenibacillus baekrokdamisoli TaxID=1712516 RepID=UPI00179BFCFE|nr:putative circularly permuted ATP-grasp superfamily protein [Paenibacillus baekrokdamisoli]